ncbi:hypothetical protein AMAG_05614 [Allomyces macrogynus ATCC 38327]|uniref:Altered inheritance of mitochondria protein 41 n=1 Tax=Allomyces macrogynus (strain ATCC 38327) TaxID=578462 RepID=A0A0L0SCS6_ALLM3|nr:hypothetical protein AMAG_05614 [Allomyces macrogynus ATCC 38327]|eukprot:KNE60195.1 hypothetical protein AMAG_05614 [Allomyces macrogynus ATCC 38327]
MLIPSMTLRRVAAARLAMTVSAPLRVQPLAATTIATARTVVPQRTSRPTLKTAMRGKDSVTSTVLRGLLSDITYATKSANPPKEYLSLVLAAHKQREDAAAQFAAAGRQDLVDKEMLEMAVLEKYLPRQLPVEEVVLRVEALCAELGVASKRDFAKLMAAVRNDPELAVVPPKIVVDAADKCIAKAAGKQ